MENTKGWLVVARPPMTTELWLADLWPRANTWAPHRSSEEYVVWLKRILADANDQWCEVSRTAPNMDVDTTPPSTPAGAP